MSIYETRRAAHRELARLRNEVLDAVVRNALSAEDRTYHDALKEVVNERRPADNPRPLPERPRR